MKHVIAIVSILSLTAAPALAQIDWDADNYGAFFDPAGTQTATTAMPGAVTAYLVLLNPTAGPVAIDGWEAGCWSVREIGEFHFPVGPELPLIFTPAWGGIVVPGDCGDGVWAGSGPGTLPAGDAVVLGSFEAVIVDLRPYGFYDTLGGGTLGVTGGQEITLQTSTYPISTMPPFLWLAATVNSDHVPVPADALEWGAVKALYR